MIRWRLIYTHIWFYHNDEVDRVEEWSFPTRDESGGVHRSCPRSHSLGCWTLYRILGRYHP